MSKPEKQPALLIADDDHILRRLLSHTFERAGLAHAVFETGDELLKVAGEGTLACVLDLQMPGRSGLECLQWLKKTLPESEVVILTNVNQANEAIDALRAGAFDYITKPFDPVELVNTVRTAMRMSRQSRENQELKQILTVPASETGLLGDSAPMLAVKSLVGRIGPTDTTVLLTGESGTGKTLLARAIHSASKRSEGPFISVNCPSLPAELLESEMFGHEKGAFSGAHQRRRGRAELADGGTLFLDEIGEMPLPLQAKLLTFLQDRTFYRVGGEEVVSSNVRIIAATNQNLEQRVKDREFREDLYFRLNVIPVEMPPLRSRPEDIPLLVKHFIQSTARSAGTTPPKLAPEVFPFLTKQPWQGNVRELENAITRACAIRANPDLLIVDDFTPFQKNLEEAKANDSHAFPVGATLAEIEKIALQKTIALCGNNKAEAARVLGIAEKSIYNKLHKHGLQS